MAIKRKRRRPAPKVETLCPVRVDRDAIISGARLSLKLPAQNVQGVRTEVVRIEAIDDEGLTMGSIDELRIWYRVVPVAGEQESGVRGRGKKTRQPVETAWEN